MSITTTTIVLLTLALFVLGLTIGWTFSSRGQKDTSTRAKLKTVVALAVTVVWIVATLADIALTGYTVSPLLHALMGAIVGYFFTEDGINLNVGGGND